MAPSAPQAISETNTVAIASFLGFVAITLAITWWAARRTTSSAEFFAAGGRVSAGQNGFALAGDYMSAASFLGIAGMVATAGFDGLIYSVGFLVGWPVMMFLVAEPLRNLGKYTFADVVAYRLRGRPVRIAAAISTLTVVSFYLVGQMVGAGELIHLLFGLPYRTAVVIVGAVMLVYVLFGGMIATTWVQIIKAGLLLTGATVLAILVLSKYGFDPLALFDAANRTHPSKHVLAPGDLVADPIDTVSLGIALMFGTAGLPHILMRFYTVPDARTARRSVAYATLLIGFFYLVTFILGFGASALVDLTGQGRNMAAPLLARELGGTALLGFIAAVAFATILAVVAGLTLSGSAALAHDLWGHVVRRGQASEAEQLRVARFATVGLAVVAIGLGILAEGENVAFIVGSPSPSPRARIPGAPAVDQLAPADDPGRGRQHGRRHRDDARDDRDVTDPDGQGRDRAAQEPRHRHRAAVVPGRDRGVAAVARARGRAGVRRRARPAPPRRRIASFERQAQSCPAVWRSISWPSLDVSQLHAGPVRSTPSNLTPRWCSIARTLRSRSANAARSRSASALSRSAGVHAAPGSTPSLPDNRKRAVSR